MQIIIRNYDRGHDGALPFNTLAFRMRGPREYRLVAGATYFKDHRVFADRYFKEHPILFHVRNRKQPVASRITFPAKLSRYWKHVSCELKTLREIQVNIN